MFEVILTVVGAAIGFGLSVLYERTKHRKQRSNVTALLSREIRANMNRLREERTLLDEPHRLEPPGMPPIDIGELASRVQRAVERHCLDATLAAMPSLKPSTMAAVFAFYESAKSVPHFWKEVERFSGNIRSGMFEESLDDVLKNGERALTELGAE